MQLLSGHRLSVMSKCVDLSSCAVCQFYWSSMKCCCRNDVDLSMSDRYLISISVKPRSLCHFHTTSRSVLRCWLDIAADVGLISMRCCSIIWVMEFRCQNDVDHSVCDKSQVNMPFWYHFYIGISMSSRYSSDIGYLIDADLQSCFFLLFLFVFISWTVWRRVTSRQWYYLSIYSGDYVTSCMTSKYHCIYLYIYACIYAHAYTYIYIYVYICSPFPMSTKVWTSCNVIS